MATELIERLQAMARKWEADGGLCERDDINEAIRELATQHKMIEMMSEQLSAGNGSPRSSVAPYFRSLVENLR